MSRFYVAPGVPVQTRVIGGHSPYSTPPYDYRLRGRGCTFCSRHCDPCLTHKLTKCNKKRITDAFPMSAVLCDRQYKYYSSSENLLADKVRELQRQEDKQNRRIRKRHTTQRSTTWYR